LEHNLFSLQPCMDRRVEEVSSLDFKSCTLSGCTYTPRRGMLLCSQAVGRAPSRTAQKVVCVKDNAVDLDCLYSTHTCQSVAAIAGVAPKLAAHSPA
jgi:hypothetical protein